MCGASRAGYREGEASESSANPRGGCGMKQGRRSAGGVRRQEVEKAWRRCEVGRGNPDVCRCLHLKTPKGRKTPGGLFACRVMRSAVGLSREEPSGSSW